MGEWGGNEGCGKVWKGGGWGCGVVGDWSGVVEAIVIIVWGVVVRQFFFVTFGGSYCCMWRMRLYGMSVVWVFCLCV